MGLTNFPNSDNKKEHQNCKEPRDTKSTTIGSQKMDWLSGSAANSCTLMTSDGLFTHGVWGEMKQFVSTHAYAQPERWMDRYK